MKLIITTRIRSTFTFDTHVNIMQNIHQSCARISRQSCIINIFKRWKKKKVNAKTGCDFALEHFDTFYRPVYGDLWPSIRVSLLSKKKTCAVLNNFTNTDDLHSKLSGAYNMFQDAAHVSEEELSETTIQQNNSSVPETVDSFSKLMRNAKMDNADEMKESKIPDELGSTGNHVNDISRTDLNAFVPALNAYSESDLLHMEELSTNRFTPADVKVNVTKRLNWKLPENLQVMVYPQSDIRIFPDPKGSLLTHYMMDAASVLPVIALDIQKDDHVLDLCSAPGGKTLTVLQTMLPEKVVCNDSSLSRLNRLNNMLRYYLPKDTLQSVEISHKDGRDLENGVYDKVLVDVPCNTDRHSLKEPINNLFVTPRQRERLSLPILQKELLIAGIKPCAPGGSVVYSTCTLSFAQNDGVVQQAIDEIWKGTNINIEIEDLAPLQTLFRKTFKFYDGCRFGQLVIPSLSSNFGPMYVCKINRNT